MVGGEWEDLTGEGEGLTGEGEGLTGEGEGLTGEGEGLTGEGEGLTGEVEGLTATGLVLICLLLLIAGCCFGSGFRLLPMRDIGAALFGGDPA